MSRGNRYGVAEMGAARAERLCLSGACEWRILRGHSHVCAPLDMRYLGLLVKPHEPSHLLRIRLSSTFARAIRKRRGLSSHEAADASSPRMNKQSIIDYYNRTAPERQRHKHMRRYYHRSLERYFSFIIPPGSRVLEIGCGTGELLAAMRPAYGVGIDFSERMIEIARQTLPGAALRGGRHRGATAQRDV